VALGALRFRHREDHHGPVAGIGLLDRLDGPPEQRPEGRGGEPVGRDEHRDTAGPDRVAELEDRIAVIDGDLARGGGAKPQARDAELVKLWQQRVDLMRQLVNVRATRARYVGL